jgi:hypothetical protein
MLSAKPVGYNSSLTTPQAAPKAPVYGSFAQTSPPPPSFSPAPPLPNQNAPNRPVSMPPGAMAPINAGVAAPNTAQAPQNRLAALPPPTSAAPVSLSTGVVHRAGPVVPKIPSSVPVVSKPPVVPKIPANIPTVSVPPSAGSVKAPIASNPPTRIQSIPPSYASPAAATSQPPQYTPSYSAAQNSVAPARPSQPIPISNNTPTGAPARPSSGPPPPSTIPPPPITMPPPPQQTTVAPPTIPKQSFQPEQLQQGPDIRPVSAQPAPPTMPTPVSLSRPVLAAPSAPDPRRQSWAPGSISQPLNNPPASNSAGLDLANRRQSVAAPNMPIPSVPSSASIASNKADSGRSSISLGTSGTPSGSKPKLSKLQGQSNINVLRQEAPNSQMQSSSSGSQIARQQTTMLKQSGSANNVSTQSQQADAGPSILLWNQIDWNNVALTRQSVLDIRTAGQQEIARTQSAADEWQQVAERLRGELQAMRLQRSRDPSLLRPNFPAWVESLSDPDRAAISRLQKKCRVNIIRMRWRHMVEDYKKTDDAKIIRRRNDVCKEIVASERQYVEYLWNLMSGYKKAFDNAIEDLSVTLKEDQEKLRKWSSQLFINAQEILKYAKSHAYNAAARRSNFAILAAST